MPDEFGKKITPEQVQAEYQKMLGYNTAVNLDETVRANENFFIGKQWEAWTRRVCRRRYTTS